MGHIARGIQLVYGQSRFRPFVWKPLLISIAVFLVVFAIGYATLLPWVQRAVAGFGIGGNVSGPVVTVLYVVIWVYISGALYSTLAFTFSAFTWEKLSYEIERQVFGDAPWMKHSMPKIMVDTGVRMLHAFCILCTGAILSFVPFVNVVFMAWLTMHDFTSSVLLRRGVFFMHQTVRIMRCKGWMWFALWCGVLMLVPFVNLFMLPALVAAGTLFICEAEGKKALPAASK